MMRMQHLLEDLSSLNEECHSRNEEQMEKYNSYVVFSAPCFSNATKVVVLPIIVDCSSFNLDTRTHESREPERPTQGLTRISVVR